MSRRWIMLGDDLGHPMEPDDLYARLVAIRHNPEREIDRYVIRKYLPGDAPGIPRGQHRSTSRIGMQLWLGGPTGLEPDDDGMCRAEDHHGVCWREMPCTVH